MKITSPKLHLSHLTANNEALLRCQTALELRDKGDFEAAQDVMRPLWKGIGQPANTEGLRPSVSAEVLLCVGILTSWIGSKNEIKEADDHARDLITESIRIHEQAHKYLNQARRLTVNLRDKVRTAQVDQSRAEVMIAQGRFKEAERVARNAARSFEKAGRQCPLVEALIIRGIAFARLGRTDQGQYTLQRAIEVAQQVGPLSLAGIAALTLIEELDDLSRETMRVAYARASDWLSESQRPDLLRRLNSAANKVFWRVGGEVTAEDADALLNKPLDFEQEKLRAEKTLIKRALTQANGSLTRAASLLNMTYQRLGYIIETRHKDLLKERSPIRRRSRKDKGQ